MIMSNHISGLKICQYHFKTRYITQPLMGLTPEVSVHHGTPQTHTQGRVNPSVGVDAQDVRVRLAHSVSLIIKQQLRGAPEE